MSYISGRSEDQVFEHVRAKNLSKKYMKGKFGALAVTAITDAYKQNGTCPGNDFIVSFGAVPASGTEAEGN